MRAILIKSLSPRKNLYRCEPPISGNAFVVSSRAAMQGGHEVYLFAANSEGKIVDWTELAGSQKLCHDLEKPLRDLGYEIETSPPACQPD